tara:strand:- start:56 stop:502 length:447 start_codon:yes stop_codon:yes gene_type:complete
MDKYNDSNSYYVKNNVEHNEYFMHQYVYNLKIVNIPKIIEYDKNKKILIMEKVSNNNLSDNYGEEASDIPDNIFNEVVNIIQTLALNGIEYPDITGYNFIEDSSKLCDKLKIWIIDFEHATLMKTSKIENIHIKNFCNGIKEWNPDFK